MKRMEKMEINCRLHQLTQSVFDELALELLMRSMRETEKNIWRVDYGLLREEIKESYFYSSTLSQDLMKCMKETESLSIEVRGAFLLGLVMRNPHWVIVEEEFLELYGSLQIEPDLLFEDYPLLMALHRIQHKGDIEARSIADSLELAKRLETKRILQNYKPLALKELADAKQMIRIEKSRVQWIQRLMVEDLPVVPENILTAILAPCDQTGETANRWRLVIDRLQRRERIGWSGSDMQRAKKGDQVTHRLLGPMQVMDVLQEQNCQTVIVKGLLRKYNFQYEKKR